MIFKHINQTLKNIYIRRHSKHLVIHELCQLYNSERMRHPINFAFDRPYKKNYLRINVLSLLIPKILLPRHIYGLAIKLLWTQ